MITELKQELLSVYKDSLTPPYDKGFQVWCEENIILPAAYAVPGRLDISISPYLIEPMKQFDNPLITQLNLIAATQTGKSLLAELAIPYIIINKPGPVFRIFHNKDVSDVFAETRLIPLLKNCKPIAPLLEYDRFTLKKSGVTLAHMAVTLGGSGTSLQHGMSVKYLLCDEVHRWDIGEFERYKARTTAFANRRKIIVSSQPSEVGSELEKINNSGLVYEWYYKCQNPACGKHQAFVWNKQRADDSYCGFQWDTVLNPDGETTNVMQSAKTTWLECEFCKHKHFDTPSVRRKLNDEGKYICVKPDGDPAIVSYNWPNFVNINLSFASVAMQYMQAKLYQKATGLDEQMKIFVTQVLGRFYKAPRIVDLGKVLAEPYDPADTDNKDWIRTLGVDVQRSGGVKYWVCWAYNRNGNESRRIDFGIARTWDEIEATRIKYKVIRPAVGIDSGDGENTYNIYQECVKHGEVIKSPHGLTYSCWTPMKGDSAPSYRDSKTGITQLYKSSPQNSQFPIGSKFRGIPAPLIIWSSTSVKIILTNLRDGKMPGVKWLIDRTDEEFDMQLRSEALREVVDKRTGAIVQRWVELGHDNHYLDACAMGLCLAIIAGATSATFTNESELKKLESVKKLENEK